MEVSETRNSLKFQDFDQRAAKVKDAATKILH